MDKPLILDLRKENDRKQYELLRLGDAKVADTYAEQKAEFDKIYLGKEKGSRNAAPETEGRWVYYPWKNLLTHLLPEGAYYLVRTARNNSLFSQEEQEKMHKLVIGVAGLSVGSNILTAMVTAGIGKTIKIADHDRVALSNLNRMQANATDLGANKAEVAAKKLWEIDPYLDLRIYTEGITAGNLEEFLISEPKLEILFDEVDDISLKFHLRLAARAATVAYAMVTDNGYQAELTLLRFDNNPQAGHMEQVPAVSLKDVAGGWKINEKLELTPLEEQELIESVIGKESMVPEMLEAGKLREQGKIAGWPQLQAISGAGASMAVMAMKQFVANMPIKEKVVLSLNREFFNA